eukprot:364536-Chlamydomonas_euryale.AAC.9
MTRPHLVVDHQVRWGPLSTGLSPTRRQSLACEACSQLRNLRAEPRGPARMVLLDAAMWVDEGRTALRVRGADMRCTTLRASQPHTRTHLGFGDTHLLSCCESDRRETRCVSGFLRRGCTLLACARAPASERAPMLRI